MFDFVIVGADLYGAVCAHELSKCYHIGGNVYTERIENTNIMTWFKSYLKLWSL